MRIDEVVNFSFRQNSWNKNFLRYCALERVSVLEKSRGINVKYIYTYTAEYFDVSRNIFNVIKIRTTKNSHFNGLLTAHPDKIKAVFANLTCVHNGLLRRVTISGTR